LYDRDFAVQTMRQGRSIIPRLALTLMALPAIAGCSSGTIGPPRDRLGALPFPGSFTFYQAADPENLGQHRYGPTPRLFRPDELGHGIVYTTRAGFLDIDHVRITIDTVRFCANRVRTAMRTRDSAVALPTIEGATFVVSLHYPPRWRSSAGDPENERVADELALRVGQRLCYLMMTWHEIITWFGYRTFPFVDESPSAFTYDDTMSHVVGLRVAGRALRDESARSFDEAVTAALRAELVSLGAVTPEHTRQAVRTVEGLWWENGKPLKRQLDVGLQDETVRPWLVRGLPFVAAFRPEPFSLPTMKNVCGRDYSGFYSVAVDPGLPMTNRIRRILPKEGARFDADRGFPLLIEVIRRQMRERFSRDVDTPWPALAATALPASGSQHPSLAPTSQPATP